MNADDGGCEDIDGKQYLFHGTGEPEKCLEMMKQFIYKPDEEFCYPRPCAIGTVYQPTIDTDQPFLALSAFRFAPKRLKVTKQDGTFRPADLRHAAIEFCRKVYRLLLGSFQFTLIFTGHIKRNERDWGVRSFSIH
jgi:apyrase